MLPSAGVNQVFGLLDLVRAYQGRTDVANLNIDLRVDIDELLPIIDTAEYFGLVTVHAGDIALTDLGRKALGAKMGERKNLMRDRLATLQPFSDVTRLLHDEKELSRLELGRYVNSKFGYITDLHVAVNLLVSWGVFAGLFRYDGESGKLLPREEK